MALTSALIRPIEERDWPQVHEIVVEVASAGETYAMDVPASVEETREFWAGQHVVVAVEGETVLASAGETYAMEVPAAVEETREFWSGQHVVVAVEGDTVLGSAKMGPNRPAQGAHVGTASFMVGAAARGRGVGRALAEHMVEWHRATGFRGIQFNAVVSTNTSAVRLWQSLGFETVGRVPGAFRLPDSEYVDLLVMYLPLVPPSAPDRTV